MGRTMAWALGGLVLGLIVSLALFGDDGPGLELRHVVMALLGAAAGGLARLALERRARN
jgi:hypothetical protein